MIYPKVIERLRDSKTLRLTPIAGAILGFKRPEDVYGIVDINGEWWYKHGWLIHTTSVLYFGYKEQCEENINNYPGGTIIPSLLENLRR